MKLIINKKEVLNKTLVIILLLLLIFLAVLSIYLYNMLTFKEIKSPSSKPKEAIEPKVYVCYEESLERKLPDCECYITKKKRVARLKGDSDGVKNFNHKLENIIDIYVKDDLTKKNLNYQCSAINDNLGFKYNIDYDTLTLEDRYIVLRVTIDVNDKLELDKIFYFDPVLDKELDEQEFVWDITNKYNKIIPVCDNNNCKMSGYKL